MNLKKGYLSSAFLLLLSTVVVKIVSAIYKIPLTSYIGAVGRGYFAFAYNICMPVHAITMGVFPIALSKLVSKYNSHNDKKFAYFLLKASNRLFFIIGFVAMALLIVCAKPYASLIAKTDGCLPTIFVIAPSVLFSCMAASYRGYFEGLMNMVPTSVSQTIEACFKMIFGLLFAKYSMAYLYNEYVANLTVLGRLAENKEQAFSMIYSITSACAMLGVTLGSVFSLAFLVLYKKVNVLPAKSDLQEIRKAKKEILSFSFPIMISTGVQSVFQFLDSSSIQLALNNSDVNYLKNLYAASLSSVAISDKEIPTYLFGIFSASLDFKNIVPGVTMALGVCAVPAISRAFEKENRASLQTITNSVFKYTSVLSCLGGFVIAFSGEEMLDIFYSGHSSDIASGAGCIVKYFALSAPLYSMAGVAVYSVQAIGRPEKNISPFLVSGVIRVILNYCLIRYTSLGLIGAVVSGAVGYFVLTFWCMAVVKKSTGIHLDIVSFVIKPVFIGTLVYFLCKSYANPVIFSTNKIILLLYKASILTGFYCILCFFTNLFSLREFLDIVHKKKLA